MFVRGSSSLFNPPSPATSSFLLKLLVPNPWVGLRLFYFLDFGLYNNFVKGFVGAQEFFDHFSEFLFRGYACVNKFVAKRSIVGVFTCVLFVR